MYSIVHPFPNLKTQFTKPIRENSDILDNSMMTEFWKGWKKNKKIIRRNDMAGQIPTEHRAFAQPISFETQAQ